MTMIDKEARAQRRREQAVGARRLRESGVLDDLFAKIDSGEVQLDGRDGLIQQLIKTGLERGLQAELTEHVGYERGDAEASFHDNSRNGSFPKTVSTIAGDVELAVPRDRNGSFTPRLVPTGQRRLGGLDEMIISLYAGGMTVRDIEHHLASTIGTDISRETISKIVDEISDEILAWQSRPLEAFYPVIYLDAIVVKVRESPRRVRRLDSLEGSVSWHDPTSIRASFVSAQSAWSPRCGLTIPASTPRSPRSPACSASARPKRSEPGFGGSRSMSANGRG